MLDQSLSQYRLLINRQIQVQNSVRDQLSKAEALTKVALETHFLKFPQFIIHDYLWVINDLIEDALGLGEKGLDSLIEASKKELDVEEKDV